MYAKNNGQIETTPNSLKSKAKIIKSENEPHEWNYEHGLTSNSQSALSSFSKYITFQESIGSFDSESILDTSRTSQSTTKVSTRQIVTPHEWREEDIALN